MKKILFVLLSIVLLSSCSNKDSVHRKLYEIGCEIDGSKPVGLPKTFSVSRLYYDKIEEGGSSALIYKDALIYVEKISNLLNKRPEASISDSELSKFDKSSYTHYYMWATEENIIILSYDSSDTKGRLCKLKLIVSK